jgi:CheY-like chemotaxis protein
MDDSEEMRETFRAMLELFGYTVECRNNGEEAIAFVKNEAKAKRKPTGMVFDLTIPGGMSGKDAIVEIRKSNPNTPVFVTSGYAEQ